MTDVIKQIHSLFEEASVDAAQNYQAASEEGVNKQSEEIKKQAKALQRKDPKTLREGAVKKQSKNSEVHC